MTITHSQTQDVAERTTPPAAESRPPTLADGIELVGEYKDSGYRVPPYVARRPDGQMIQMPELLYRVAEHIDGKRGYDEIGAGVTRQIGRGLTGEAAEFLVEEKLRPLGIVAGPNGEQPVVNKADPLLALRLKTAVVPKGVTRAITTIFLPFFWPPILIAVLASIAAVDVWFFFMHGVAQSARALAYNPILLLMVLGLVVLATALHEIGHATATRYGGAEPGDMGVGIYIVWPAFYTDVTDSYRLGRGGRLRTDLGGVYFNGLFVLLIAGAYAYTRFEPLLILIVVQHFQALQQFLPFLRLDGYYILSDLVGVPDMFARLKPTLKSAVPGTETDRRAAELKPWVRAVTTAWVLTLIPVLAFTFGVLIFNLPRMLATAWDSLLLQLDKVGSGDGLTIAAGGIQTLALLLPLAGTAYTMTNVGSRVAAGAWSWSAGSKPRRGTILAVTHASALLAGWVLLPNGDYRPIQASERGTFGGAVRQFTAVQTGRPGLTVEREEELGGAPGRSDSRDERPTDEEPATTEPTQTEQGVSTQTESRPSTTTGAGRQTQSDTGAATPTETDPVLSGQTGEETPTTGAETATTPAPTTTATTPAPTTTAETGGATVGTTAPAGTDTTVPTTTTETTTP